MRPEVAGLILPFSACRRTCLDVVAAVGQGPGLVVLEGPPGAGKTTILQKLAKSSVSSGRALLREVGQKRPDDVTLDLVDNLDEDGLALLLADPLRVGCQVAAAGPDLALLIRQASPNARFVHVRPLGADDIRLLLETRRTQAKLPQGAFTLRSQAALERLCGGNPARLVLLVTHAMADARAAGSGRISAALVEQAAATLSATLPTLCHAGALETQWSASRSCKIVISPPQADPAPISGQTAVEPSSRAGLPATEAPAHACEPVPTSAFVHPVPGRAPTDGLADVATTQHDAPPLRSWDLLTRPLTAAEKTGLHRRKLRRRSVRIAACVLPAVAVASYCVLRSPAADMRNLVAASVDWLGREATSMDRPSRPSVAQLARPAEPAPTSAPKQDASRSAPPAPLATADLPRPVDDGTVRVAATEPAAIPSPAAVDPTVAPILLQLPEPADIEPPRTDVMVSAVPEPARPAPPPTSLGLPPTPPVAATPPPPAVALAHAKPAPPIADPAKAARLFNIGKVLLAIGQTEDGRDMVEAAAQLGSPQARAVSAGFAPRRARRGPETD